MDHVRGSSLAWTESLEALRPFIVTWWSGRSADSMPTDVRKVYDEANFGADHVNLALLVLDEHGKLLRSTIPFVQPPAYQFDPEAQGRGFKKQLDELFSGLSLPKPPTASRKLKLPSLSGPGVRVYLTFDANRLNHYRTPTVEAVATTMEMGKALRYSAIKREISISTLRPWLEQLYPPAIMDGYGGFSRIEGKLIAQPAGKDKTHRYVVVEGEVRFELDNQARSTYSGKLSVVLQYSLGSDLLGSVRGVFDSEIPKGPERIPMHAAIESI